MLVLFINILMGDEGYIVPKDTHQIQYGRKFDQIIEFQLDESE